MRIFVLAAAFCATLVPVAAAADAQSWNGRGHGYAYGRHDAREARQCRRAIARADNRWELRRAQRFCRSLRNNRSWHSDNRRWRRH